jgi:hypothetical protein
VGHGRIKPEKPLICVIPAEAGIHPASCALVKAYAEPISLTHRRTLDSGFRRNDGGATTNLAHKIFAQVRKSEA